MRSSFGNVPSNNTSNCPKKIIHIVDFSNVTLGAVTRNGSSLRNFNQTINCGDLNSTILNNFFDANYVLQSQGIIDRDVAISGALPADIAADAANFVTSCETTVKSVIGPDGTSVPVLFQNMKNKANEPPAPNNVPPQHWLRVLRAQPVVGRATDMPELHVSFWFKLQVEGAVGMSTFLDVNDPTGVAFWKSILELKAAGYGGGVNSTGAGDYRFSFRVQEELISGTPTLRWHARGDNSAANTTVPGVTGNQYRFWKRSVTTPLVLDDTWFKVDIRLSRHQAINRTIVTITPSATRVSSIVCDFISAGSLRGVDNAQEGLYGLPWGQMFFAGQYADSRKAVYPMNQYIYDLQVWGTSTPRHLGRLPCINHGPLPWVPTPLSRASYFASTTGSSGNPGTINSPKDLQHAISAANPGDVVFIRGGTYSVTSAHIQLWQDGTAQNPIIYEAYPGETVIFDGSGITPGVGSQYCVNCPGSYQILRGITIRNFPEYGVYNQGNNNIFDGCNIYGNRLSGVQNTGNNTGVINCTIHANSDVGLTGGNYANGGNADAISFSSGSGCYAKHNLIYGNSDDGIDTWQSQGTTVSYNIVYGNGLGAGNGNGIKAGGASVGRNAYVDHNLVYSNRGNGIDSNTGINVTFLHNTEWSNGGNGYVMETDTIATRNIAGSTTRHGGVTGIMTDNSWDISAVDPTFLSTNPLSSDFLKINPFITPLLTTGGTTDIGFDTIGAHWQ